MVHFKTERALDDFLQADFGSGKLSTDYLAQEPIPIEDANYGQIARVIPNSDIFVNVSSQVYIKVALPLEMDAVLLYPSLFGDVQ